MHRPRRHALLLRSTSWSSCRCSASSSGPGRCRQHQRARPDGRWPHGDRGSRQADGEGLMRALTQVILAAAIGLGLAGSGLRRRRGAISLCPSRTGRFDGLFGTFDRAAAPARLPGLQGSLLDLPRDAACCPTATSQALGFSEDEVKAIAAAVQVTGGPNDARRDVRAARPSRRTASQSRSRTSRRPAPPTTAPFRRTCR